MAASYTDRTGFRGGNPFIDTLIPPKVAAASRLYRVRCVLHELLLSYHICQSKWLCDIADFTNDIEENGFAQLLSSVGMSVITGCNDCFSEGSNLLDSVLWRCYQLKAEMTDAFSCHIALRLISGFPQRSRQSEMWRHFNCPLPDVGSMLGFFCI